MGSLPEETWQMEQNAHQRVEGEMNLDIIYDECIAQLMGIYP